MPAKRTRDEFVDICTKVHNGVYNYDNVIYINNITPVKIKCNIHGEFEQIPKNHLKGAKCPKCNDEEARSRCKHDESIVISKFKKIHGNKYDYSYMKYVNNKIHIDIICKKHGMFSQRPDAHSRGVGCPKCKGDGVGARFTHSREYIISKFKEIHGNKYDYSQIKYNGNKNKVNIICKDHGLFKQVPQSHLKGIGCPKCAIDKSRVDKELLLEQFRNVHGDRYDYSKVTYIRSGTKIEIICKKHGSFMQTPKSHKEGRGCPKCNNSAGEMKISRLLEDNNIDYVYNGRYKIINMLQLDFFIPDKNIAIEFDGIQHYEFVPRWHRTIEGFEESKNRDKLKDELCKANNIKLIRIPYYDIDNISQILIDNEVITNDK